MSFCSLTKGSTPNISRLCVCVVCVLINKCSFEQFIINNNDDDDDDDDNEIFLKRGPLA